jgi:hypothetical protein
MVATLDLDDLRVSAIVNADKDVFTHGLMEILEKGNEGLTTAEALPNPTAKEQHTYCRRVGSGEPVVLQVAEPSQIGQQHAGAGLWNAEAARNLGDRQPLLAAREKLKQAQSALGGFD